VSRRSRKIFGFGIFSVVLAYALMRLFVAPMVDKSLNLQVPHRPYVISDAAAELHSGLRVMDWHTDTMLWDRDLLERSSYGHLDLPRMADGNIAVQMFTTVTKTPRGQNYDSNTGDSDNITSLAVVQGWPVRTWSSLLERALYQAERLDGFVTASEGKLVWIKSKGDLAAFTEGYTPSVWTGGARGVLLGSEGAHPLEGDLANIDRMFDAGYRMIGLTHFFDNDVAGSLHGTSKAGLSDFGRQVVAQLDAREIIIDLAHASEQAAWETLSITKRPVVVSHTGFKGACNSARNVSDDLMKAIADKGGLIAVGFWQGAVCGDTPDAIADAIEYGIGLVGADHVALGSDWDGTTHSITAEDLPAITDMLLQRGVPEEAIRKVMGENSLRFLGKWLPAT